MLMRLAWVKKSANSPLSSKEAIVKRLQRLAAIGLLVALACSGTSLAQTVTKVGTTAAKFLSIPVGARAIGMGGAFVGVTSDASAMYWNVAGLTQLTESEASFSHTNWLADISFNYGAVSFPLGEIGIVGINFTSMSMAEMERTTETQPEGTGESFGAGSIAVGVSYARALADWFSIGGNVKYINEHIWNSSATGLALDIGTLFTTPFPGLKFGAGISNFGAKMKIGGDDLLVQKDISPDAGNNANVNANLTTESFDLPLILRIGLAYEPFNTETHQLILTMDATHPNDNSESLSFGAEYSLFQRLLSLRGGYRSLGYRDSEEEFTLGAGVQYEVSPGLVARADYAFEKFGRLKDVHTFSFGITF